MVSCGRLASGLFELSFHLQAGRLTISCRIPSCPTPGHSKSPQIRVPALRDSLYAKTQFHHLGQFRRLVARVVSAIRADRFDRLEIVILDWTWRLAPRLVVSEQQLAVLHNGLQIRASQTAA